jgi:hypothetical protein
MTVMNMLKNSVKVLIYVYMVLVFVSTCFAVDSATVPVAAAIPRQNGLTVTVSRVTGATWSPATSLDFGKLNYDETNKIFTVDFYYAVDVGVSSNDADWGVKHTTSSIVNGTQTLDHNINVTFIKQLTDTASDTNPLAYLSFADSNNKEFRKADLGGGWLRIYYGLATGDPAKPDAPGVVPVLSSNTSGSYQGSVNLTLTP